VRPRRQLSGLLICQLIREGAPVIGASGILYMDMSKGLISCAAHEFMLAMTAFSEMCHYYKLLIFSFAGCSDAKTFDQQAAAEGSLWMLVTALSGGNLIHDVGYVESGLTASYEMLVSMDEIALTLKDRAQAKVREILEHYQPVPLDEVTAAELEAVIQRAEERVP
jgi:trimethylamine:corrinoid methyltransferase-like protein